MEYLKIYSLDGIIITLTLHSRKLRFEASSQCTLVKKNMVVKNVVENQ